MEIIDYKKEDWNNIVNIYNSCMKIYLANNGFEDVSDEGKFLAMTALKNAFTLSLDNRLDIRRTRMMIQDFINWYNKLPKHSKAATA